MLKFLQPHQKTTSRYTVFLTPTFIMLFVSLILLSIGLICTYKLRPFNSDDVFWQAILLHWHPFSGSTVTLGNSSIYVDKIPFYELMNIFFEPSRKLLFIEAAVPAIIGFCGFYLSSIYFLKKANVQLSYHNLFPFVWVASLGYMFIQLYLNPNWRGFQLGFSFVIFALTAAIWNGDISLKSWKSKILLVIVCLYSGLQIYSDPYFLYFTVIPIIAFAFILFALNKINRLALNTTLIAILSSYIVSKIFAFIFIAAGIRSNLGYPMQFVQFDQLATNFFVSIHSILVISNADFFGLKLTSSTLIPLLNFFVVGIISFAICYVLFKAFHRTGWRKLSIDHLWMLFFSGLVILVFTVHTFSTMSEGNVSFYRYFLISTLACALLLSYFVSLLPKKYSLAIAILISGAIAANVYFSLIGYGINMQQNRANSLNYTAIDTLEKETGITKGYANYWDANITSFLSKGKYIILPTLCTNGALHQWHWLVDEKSFNTHSNKSFYLYNADNALGPCTQKILNDQLGEPSKVLTTGSWQILIYDYDIAERLPHYKVKY